jgi:hypothetical protein
LRRFISLRPPWRQLCGVPESGQQTPFIRFDLVWLIARIGRLGYRLDFDRQTEDAGDRSQPSGITDYQRATPFINLVMSQGFDNDFGAYSSWVTDGDPETRRVTYI